MAMYVGIIYKYATLFDLLVQKGPMSVQLGHFRARVACSSRPLLSKGSGKGRNGGSEDFIRFYRV